MVIRNQPTDRLEKLIQCLERVRLMFSVISLLEPLQQCSTVLLLTLGFWTSNKIFEFIATLLLLFINGIL
eukprot:snap_masked-scaffold_32-processed-gene-1.23-mRNA-1 protein AED:1.00 eAED:1.00 QI:0/0/0/0/1/1/2/0/69